MPAGFVLPGRQDPGGPLPEQPLHARRRRLVHHAVSRLLSRLWRLHLHPLPSLDSRAWCDFRFQPPLCVRIPDASALPAKSDPPTTRLALVCVGGRRPVIITFCIHPSLVYWRFAVCGADKVCDGGTLPGNEVSCNADRTSYAGSGALADCVCRAGSFVSPQLTTCSNMPRHGLPLTALPLSLAVSRARSATTAAPAPVRFGYRSAYSSHRIRSSWHRC